MEFLIVGSIILLILGMMFETFGSKLSNILGTTLIGLCLLDWIVLFVWSIVKIIILIFNF